MKKYLFVLFILFPVVTVQAQATFQRIYSNIPHGVYDMGVDVMQTMDGGYAVIGGNTLGAYLLKIKSNGDTAWVRSYLGQGDVSFGIVRRTTDGGFLIHGNYLFSGGPRGLLVKTDSAGNIGWASSYSGIAWATGACMEITADGGYIVAGQAATGPMDMDLLILKSGPGGWARTYGNGNESAGSIIQTFDGGNVVAGKSGTGSDCLLMKTDSSGNQMWVKKFGNSGSEYPLNVIETNDSGLALLGHTASFSSATETFLLKTDSDGATLWTKVYPGIDGRRVVETSGSDYMMTGYSPGGPFLLRLDSQGAPLWAKTYDVPNADAVGANSLQPTADGGFVFSGDIFLQSDTGIYLVKTDSNGNGVCSASMINVGVLPVSFTSTSPVIPLTSNSGGAGALLLQSVPYNVFVTDPCVTGMDETDFEDPVSVFPNPFSGQTTLRVEKYFKNATLMVYNSQGRSVKQMNNISGQEIIFTRDNFQEGLYLFRLTEGDKPIGSGKLLITDK